MDFRMLRGVSVSFFLGMGCVSTSISFAWNCILPEPEPFTPTLLFVHAFIPGIVLHRTVCLSSPCRMGQNKWNEFWFIKFDDAYNVKYLLSHPVISPIIHHVRSSRSPGFPRNSSFFCDCTTTVQKQCLRCVTERAWRHAAVLISMAQKKRAHRHSCHSVSPRTTDGTPP